MKVAILFWTPLALLACVLIYVVWFTWKMVADALAPW